MMTLKMLLVKVAWDRPNDADLDNGYTPANDERFHALKFGPFVVMWGIEDWSE